ncbi:hypothetical protein [Chondromyces crocatus]|nr:hypothetical protein [Chondromyces crocatus]
MKLLRQIALPEGTAGKARHTRNGAILLSPAALSIVQYASDPGFYLLYVDAEGRELTDTYHDTLDGALSQAEWEFAVTPGQWKIVPDS